MALDRVDDDLSPRRNLGRRARSAVHLGRLSRVMVKAFLLLLAVGAAALYLSTEGGSDAYRQLSDAVGEWFIDTFSRNA